LFLFADKVTSVLSPPAPCSRTIRTLGSTLSGLDDALNKTGLYPTLDHAPNVTCLAPNTNAFTNAGNPQTVLNASELSGALLYHTLPMPLYTSFLTDGQEITSLANLTVRVTVNDSGIWFNDAKVIGENVL
jgi:transforming growth factor-beta-induced protein